jgi:hypothetical protein
MKKLLLILASVALLIAFSGCSFSFSTDSTDEENSHEVVSEDDTVIEEEVIEEILPSESNILNAFAVKHPDWDMSNYSVSIEKEDSTHAFGYSDPVGGGPGGWWYAAKSGNSWLIIQDGNGDPECSVLEQYEIPEDWYTYNGLKGCF